MAVVAQTIGDMKQFHPINPHDHFPPELLTNLRLDTLQHTRESFLSASENEKRIDLLYSANFVDGSEVLIYFLLEHKSDIDRRIALQLLEYVLKIHEWRRRNNQPLCVVIPLVIYHGDKPWDEPTSLRHKIPATRQLSGFIPDMQAIVIDFSRQSPDIFSQPPELEARIRTLQLARRAELQFDSVVAIFRLLQFWREIASHKEALNDIILYLCQVFDARRLKWFQQAIRTGLKIDAENQMPTCYEALIEQGLEQGLEKGRAEGREEGLLMGRIRTLQEVLRQPVTPQQTLATLPLQQLQSLATQLQELLEATRPPAQ
jgi:predicted transposase YdaD